jgi:hypothetical protein
MFLKNFFLKNLDLVIYDIIFNSISDLLIDFLVEMFLGIKFLSGCGVATTVDLNYGYCKYGVDLTLG